VLCGTILDHLFLLLLVLFFWVRCTSVVLSSCTSIPYSVFLLLLGERWAEKRMV
jgi:hypothetical protein